MADAIARSVIEVAADISEFATSMAKAENLAKHFEDVAVGALGRGGAAASGLGASAATGSQALEKQIERRIQALQREIVQQTLSREQQMRYFNDLKGAGAAGEPLVQMYEKIRRAQEQVAAGAKAQAGNDSFIKGLESRTNAIGKSIAQLQLEEVALLKSEAAMRGVSKEAAASIAKMEGAALATLKLGQSAGQTRQALAQLPAQFTDIFTSLAGGQNPLLVLIQQGGQIKDSFGGIGNALSALGKVFTPFRLIVGGAVGALGLLAYGFLKGQQETSAYNRAIILSGNAAGVTTGQLQNMAKAQSNLVGTQGAAASALTQLAATGKVFGAQMALASEAAVRLERVGGPAIEDTVKAFAELGRDPVNASLKLNESTNFLTLSLYRQIKALQEVGKTAEAAALAQDAAAKAAIESTKELEPRLGFIERAWKSIKDAIVGVADATLNIGRPDAPDAALAAARTLLNQLRTERAVIPQGAPGVRSSYLDAEIARVEKFTKAEDANTVAIQANAQAKKDQKRATDAGVESDKITDKFKTPSTILDTERAKVIQLSAEASKALTSIVGNNVSAFKQSAADAGEVAAKLKTDLANVNLYSQKNALDNASSQAKLAARGQLAKQANDEVIKGIEDRLALEKLGTTNTLTNTNKEIAAINAKGVAAEAFNKGEEARLRRAVVLAGGLPKSGAAIIAAQGQVDVFLAKSAADELSRRAAVKLAVEKHAAAIRELMVALRAEGEGEIDAQLKEQAQQRAALVTSVLAYKDGIDETIESNQLELSLMGASNEQRKIAIEQHKIELGLRKQLATINATPFDPNTTGRQDQIDIVNAAAAKAKADIAANITFEAFERRRRDIEDSIYDAITHGASNAKDYIKNLFKKLVFNVIVDPLVRPIAGAIASVFTGAVAAADGTGAAGGAGVFGTASGAASLFNAGKTIYSGFESGFANVSSAYSNFATSAYGQSLGLSNAATVGNNASAFSQSLTSTGSLVGSVATVAAGVAVGVVAGRAISGGYSAAGGQTGNTLVNVGTGVGGVIGAYFGGPFGAALGAALGGAIGGGLNRLFGRKAEEVEARNLTGTFSGSGDFTGSVVTDLIAKGGTFRSDKRSQEIDAITGALDKSLDQGAASLIALANQYGKALGLPVDQLKNVTTEVTAYIDTSAVDELSKKYGQALSLPFDQLSDAAKKIVNTSEFEEAVKKDADENQRAITSALSKFGEALLSTFAANIEPLRLASETTAQAIERVGGALIGVNAVLDDLGIAALGASLAGGSAAVDLAALFGGVQTFAQAASSFADKFTPAAEKTANLQQAIADVLSQAGAELPKTRAAFRDLVEAQNLTTVSGMNTFAALLGVSDAFDTLQTAAQTASDELAELQRGLNDAIDSTLTKFQTPAQQARTGYERVSKGLAGAGIDIGVDALMMATKESIFEFAQAFILLDTNTIEAKKAVVDAADALADLRSAADEAAAAVATKREDLTIQLLRAEGNELAAVNIERQRELDALALLDDSLVSIQKSIYAASQMGRVLAGVDSVIGDFLKGSELATYKAERIQQTLAKGGINATVEGILTSTLEGVKNLYNEVGLDGKEAVLAAYGAWKDLQEVIYGATKAIQAYRAGTLADAIEQARLRTLTPAGRIASLKSTERSLFGQLSTADDPLAIAEKLQQVITTRLSEQAAMEDKLKDSQKESLQERIDGEKRLRDLSKDIAQFNGELRFGDLSPLSRRDQVGSAQSLYESTLAGARGGDQTAVGNLLSNARAYLDEAAGAFASSAAYTSIFNQVTKELDALGVTGAKNNNAEIWQKQLDALGIVADNSPEMLAALLSIDAILAARAATVLGPSVLPPALPGPELFPAIVDSPAAQNQPVFQETWMGVQGEQLVTMSAMSTQLTTIAVNTAKLEALLATAEAQNAIAREGYLQTIARLEALLAIQQAMLTETQVGPPPA